jgi:hypothetical protein
MAELLFFGFLLLFMLGFIVYAVTWIRKETKYANKEKETDNNALRNRDSKAGVEAGWIAVISRLFR